MERKTVTKVVAGVVIGLLLGLAFGSQVFPRTVTTLVDVDREVIEWNNATVYVDRWHNETVYEQVNETWELRDVSWECERGRWNVTFVLNSTLGRPLNPGGVIVVTEVGGVTVVVVPTHYGGELFGVRVCPSADILSVEYGGAHMPFPAQTT